MCSGQFVPPDGVIVQKGEQMGDGNRGANDIELIGCPRVARAQGFAARCDGLCPALSGRRCGDEEADAQVLASEVEGLLGCRGFLWDVLMDGEWTGCARQRLAELAARYGAERVADAFEQG